MTTELHPPPADRSDEAERSRMFDVIRTARALVKQHTGPLAESSQQDYARRLRRILEEIEATTPASGLSRIETFLGRHARTSKTYYKYRALLCRHMAAGLRARLTQQDRLQKAGLVEVWQGAMRSLEAAMEALQRVHQLKIADLLARSGQTAAKSKSKRNQKLPRGWADKVLANSIGHRFYRAILTLCVTGCRPGEIHGAKFIYAENRIFVEIKGKKSPKRMANPCVDLPFRLKNYQKVSWTICKERPSLN